MSTKRHLHLAVRAALAALAVASASLADPGSSSLGEKLEPRFSMGRVSGYVGKDAKLRATIALPSLPAVGLAPGFVLALRHVTDGLSAECGTACELLVARVDPSDSSYVVREADGTSRVFAATTPASSLHREQTGGARSGATMTTLAEGGFKVVEADGRSWRTFDDVGQLEEVVNPWGTVTLAYDGARLVSVTSQLGRSVTLAYDPDTNLLASVELSATANQPGTRVSLSYADSKICSVDGTTSASGFAPRYNFTWRGTTVVEIWTTRGQPTNRLFGYATDAASGASYVRSSATQGTLGRVPDQDQAVERSGRAR